MTCDRGNVPLDDPDLPDFFQDFSDFFWARVLTYSLRFTILLWKSVLGQLSYETFRPGQNLTFFPRSSKCPTLSFLDFRSEIA